MTSAHQTLKEWDKEATVLKSLVVKKIPFQYRPLQINIEHRDSDDTDFFQNEWLDTIKFLPGIVKWKNRDLIFMGCNQRLAELENLQSTDDIIGKMDSDFTWGQGENSSIFREEDQQVLNGVIIYILAKYKFLNSEKLVLVKKMPILNKNGNIKGIFNYLIEYPSENLSNIISSLTNIGVEASPFIVESVRRMLSDNTLHLSLREEECYYYLAQGHSTKEIGKTLGLSHRTIEHYLETLKSKLNCRKVSSLMIKMTELGYSSEVLASIFSRIKEPPGHVLEDLKIA